jgi:hypothetical protein
MLSVKLIERLGAATSRGVNQLCIGLGPLHVRASFAADR